MPKFIEEWNYDQNVPFEPILFSAFGNQRVWWICSRGHEWEAAIADRSKVVVVQIVMLKIGVRYLEKQY